MRRFSFLLVFITISLLISCDGNKLDVDVSQIVANVEFKRFEQDLFEKDNVDPAFFEDKYDDFFKYYVEDMLSIGIATDLAVGPALEAFRNDETMKEVYDKVKDKFGDFNEHENDIIEAFKHYKYYFPDKKCPNIVTYISGFNYALGVTETDMALGLDMYLGSDCVYYQRLGISQYKVFNMTPENLKIDAVKGWLMTEFYPTEEDEKTLLSKMVYEGKILYLLDAMYPNKRDSIKIGFSQYEIDWCKSNEFNLWSHFIDKELLYTKNKSTIVQYTGEGPFTTGLDKTSPARVGVWMGWQIVRSFMDKNSKVSLEKLMGMNDAQIILTKSGYKPKK